MTKTSIPLSFAAIDQYIETNIKDAQEISTKNNFITWGSDNKYPQYLYELSNNVSVLKTIINGTADYVVGESIESNLNITPEKLEDIVYNLALDYLRYGGFALDIERDAEGKVALIDYLDFKNIRSNAKNDVLYYSADWNKSYGRVKTLAYPRYTIDGKEHSSIFYYKNNRNQVYPTPLYSGDGVIAAEAIKCISQYHINQLNNNFSSNYIINLNNGEPSDEVKEEIEENFTEKFCGVENAGRPVIAYNKDKEHSAEIIKIQSDDWGDRYKALKDNSKQTLFTAFRAIPCLFGITDDNKGFAQQEYADAFKLFNKTVVTPIQKKICNAFDSIFGGEGVLTIVPFKIDFENNETNDIIQ